VYKTKQEYEKPLKLNEVIIPRFAANLLSYTKHNTSWNWVGFF